MRPDDVWPQLEKTCLSSLEQLLHRNVQWFRDGLVFKADRPLYHSILGLIVIHRRERARRGTPAFRGGASCTLIKAQKELEARGKVKLTSFLSGGVKVDILLFCLRSTVWNPWPVPPRLLTRTTPGAEPRARDHESGPARLTGQLTTPLHV